LTVLIKHDILHLILVDFDTFEIVACECEDLVEVLVNHGLFPTSPSQPRMAVSIPLIQLYHALFERSCDAINAFAHALNTFYGRRGFIHCNSKVCFQPLRSSYCFIDLNQGEVVQDTFRRGFGHAVQWYDSLQVRIEHQLEGAILAGDATVRDCKQPVPLMLAINPEAPTSRTGQTIVDAPLSTPGQSNPEAPISLSPSLESKSPLSPSPLRECHRTLQRRCPACFALNKFGRSGRTYVDCILYRIYAEKRSLEVSIS
jgi:hypothetical protein